jgi:pilus assembly protein FimV
LSGSPSPLATPDETVGLESGLSLDLENDRLEQTLGELGETGYLNDLESVADALKDLDAPVEAAASAFGLDTSLDLAAPALAAPADLDGDLSAEFDLGNLESALPEIDRLDLAASEAGATASAPIGELPDLAAELPPEFDAAAAERDADDDGDEFDFLADADEIATKLDLARAYIDMGDTDGAKDILDEVLQEGTDTQRQEASTLLDRIA